MAARKLWFMVGMWLEGSSDLVAVRILEQNVSLVLCMFLRLVCDRDQDAGHLAGRE